MKTLKRADPGHESLGHGELVHFSPSLLIKTFTVVFVSEFTVMLLLSWLNLSWGYWTGLLDSFLLTFLIAVPLYYLVFRPTAELATHAVAAERLRRVLEALPIAARVIQNGRVDYSNSADAALFGYENPSEIIGTDAFIYIADEDVPRLRGYAAQRAAGEPAPTRYEAHGKHRDGSSIPLEIFAIGITHNGQRASLAVLNDLRERKRLQLLESILPICCVCKKVRDDTGTERGKGPWRPLEKFVMERSDTSLSHGYCPECYRACCVQHGFPLDGR